MTGNRAPQGVSKNLAALFSPDGTRFHLQNHLCHLGLDSKVACAVVISSTPRPSPNSHPESQAAPRLMGPFANFKSFKLATTKQESHFQIKARGTHYTNFRHPFPRRWPTDHTYNRPHIPQREGWGWGPTSSHIIPGPPLARLSRRGRTGSKGGGACRLAKIPPRRDNRLS